MKVVTKQEARSRGLARYFTGLPCRWGHVAQRYTKRADCVECRNAIVLRWRRSNPQAYVAGTQRWRESNPERARALGRHQRAIRRARELRATPKWVDVAELRRIYENCPKGFEVDHIIPLAGENVCGLHVPWNLQYLPEGENKKKGARFSG